MVASQQPWAKVKAWDRNKHPSGGACSGETAPPASGKGSADALKAGVFVTVSVQTKGDPL